MLSSVAIGKKELQLLANAATPYLFKQTFKLDLMKVFSGFTNNEDVSEAVNLMPQLAYIMAKQAEGLKPSDFIKLSEDSFYLWLEEYEPMDFAYASEAIIAVYMGNQDSSARSKKKAER